MQNILNRLLLPVSRYHAYESDAAGWSGWYTFMGRCTAFKGTDGTLLTTW